MDIVGILNDDILKLLVVLLSISNRPFLRHAL
jgi:hypothetical protein